VIYNIITRVRDNSKWPVIPAISSWGNKDTDYAVYKNRLRHVLAAVDEEFKVWRDGPNGDAKIRTLLEWCQVRQHPTPFAESNAPKKWHERLWPESYQSEDVNAEDENVDDAAGEGI
jgi:hypothetical protein